MRTKTDDLTTAIKSIHKGLHQYRRAFARLPEPIRKRFRSEHEQITFNINAEAGLIADMVIELLR